MFEGGVFNLTKAFPVYCLLSLISLAPAFLLHEFAHKFVAKYYGCWAEFRADPAGLRFGLILAAFLGIVFMAPGAVMVAGNATRNQFGKIAVAGPITNMALWTLGYAAWIVLGGFVGSIDVIIGYWLWGNAILCAFNMLPFGPLDGKKIKTWSEPIFYTCLSVAVALVYITHTKIAIF
jgi:Zn-dependent protease